MTTSGNGSVGPVKRPSVGGNRPSGEEAFERYAPDRLGGYNCPDGTTSRERGP
jgi:hypothetical protein